MKKDDEKSYYAYLEKIIREQKSSSFFWKENTNSYEMDILLLMNHIAKKNPALEEKILDNFVDTTGMKDCSKHDILTFMARTEKGTICKWKNENGEEVYLLNNGERFNKKSKQILVLGNHLNKGDFEMLKKSMYGTVLKKDIKKVYDKIAREESQKQQRKAFGLKKVSFIEKMSEKKEKIIEHSASEFERNFKLLVKEQGSLCIPISTADTMLTFMSGIERKKLFEGLNQRGVTNEIAWEKLLTTWKNEALNPKIELEKSYKKTRKTRKIQVLRNL